MVAAVAAAMAEGVKVAAREEAEKGVAAMWEEVMAVEGQVVVVKASLLGLTVHPPPALRAAPAISAVASRHEVSRTGLSEQAHSASAGVSLQRASQTSSFSFLRESVDRVAWRAYGQTIYIHRSYPGTCW